jgi:hypothetical protein
MKTLRFSPLLLSFVIALFGALALSSVAATHADARASISPVNNYSNSQARSVLRLATSELKKGARETRGNNVVRYRNKRLAPYNVNAAWSGAFVSYLLTRARVSGINNYTNLTSSSGIKVIGYVPSFQQWAKNSGRLSKTAKPGYLALYGSSHIAVVASVDRRGKARTVIAGNVNDRVRKTVAGIPSAYIRI